MSKYIVTFFDNDDSRITEESVSCFREHAEDVAVVAVELSLGHKIPEYAYVDIEEVKG